MRTITIELPDALESSAHELDMLVATVVSYCHTHRAAVLLLRHKDSRVIPLACVLDSLKSVQDSVSSHSTVRSDNEN